MCPSWEFLLLSRFLFCQSCLSRFFLPILEVGFQLNKEETTDSVEGDDRSLVAVDLKDHYHDCLSIEIHVISNNDFIVWQ